VQYLTPGEYPAAANYIPKGPLFSIIAVYSGFAGRAER